MKKKPPPGKSGNMGTKALLVVLALAVSFLVATNVRADKINDFGIGKETAPGVFSGINDANPYDDGDGISTNLYDLFNRYFAAQGANYVDSNELFEDLGVAPTTNWQTASDSRVVGVFKVAGFEHALNMYSQSGDFLGNIVSYVNDTSGNAIVNDDVDVSGAGAVSFQLDALFWGTPTYSWYSNPESNADGMVHMIALNITDLYNLKYLDAPVTSAYMFAWEDLHRDAGPGGFPLAADWDYQDFVVIMTNVRPKDEDIPPVVPEPATLALMGLGLIGVGLARRRMR